MSKQLDYLQANLYEMLNSLHINKCRFLNMSTFKRVCIFSLLMYF